jgi:hypothetical protein
VSESEYKIGDKVMVLPHDREYHYLDAGTIAEVEGYWYDGKLEVVGASAFHGDLSCSQIVKREHIRPLRDGEEV